MIIAIKGGVGAKSRLAGVLPPRIRARLVRMMLQHVVSTVQAAGGVGEILLVSGDAREYSCDAVAVRDASQGLSIAFETGARVATARGHRTAVLLPADLPMLAPADLEALLRVGHAAKTAIAPNRAGDGTNAMYVPLELPVRLAFGARSYAKHLSALVHAGFTPGIVTRRGFAMDIDEVPDLDLLRGRQQYDFLGLPKRLPA